MESFTRLPPEIVDYAAREYPETAIGQFFERALRRVANSNVAERKSLVAIGKPFTNDLASWVRCPYSIESSVWDRFTETIEKRKEHPGAILAGAVMMELGMTSDSATPPSSEQRPTNVRRRAWRDDIGSGGP